VVWPKASLASTHSRLRNHNALDHDCQIHLLPSDHEFPAESHETLLEAALRAGLAPNYSCSNGSCGQCRARVVSGRLGETRFHDYVINEQTKPRAHF